MSIEPRPTWNNEMKLRIDKNGVVHGMYRDQLMALDLGAMYAKRASNLEFDQKAQDWVATIADTGEYLCRGKLRSQVAKHEVELLEDKWFTKK